MITLQPKAERDLKRIGPGPQRIRILAGLRGLDAAADNVDIKALVGSAAWLRLRIGDYRVLYRDVDSETGAIQVSPASYIAET
ncbi:MAG: type II toxin-antitoxin system RelE family toxin [Mycobacteriales bacterium]